MAEAVLVAPPTVPIHTNARRSIRALVAQYTIRRNSPCRPSRPGDGEAARLLTECAA
jgi:hypothetical protein